ncbi:TetR/AcrR family transcriptional regulator [Hymenobacter caeli]|uniref:AcrR family transcriptional regulator n=1 Tax=Hymenobacter caeli TaxID=2735894 RepID=A0ABX2FKS2_9BACT|nr:TetR/AcrR family transcriptional regulator [Hymenobacter caeli]NRT17727.1 AcrR family transcriptional regulator [Hymenobacter caeli]
MPTAPPTRTKEETTRENVVQAAQRLFQQHGLHKVTMDDVAKAIGKGKSTLYYYYKNKEEIFSAVLDRETADMVQRVTRAVDEAATAEGKLFAFSAGKLRELREKVALYNILSQEIMADACFLRSIRQRHLKQESTLLKSILVFGAASGELKTLTPQELDTMAFVFLSGLYGLEQEMVFANNFELMEPAVTFLSRTVVHGLKA